MLIVELKKIYQFKVHNNSLYLYFENNWDHVDDRLLNTILIELEEKHNIKIGVMELSELLDEIFLGLGRGQEKQSAWISDNVQGSRRRSYAVSEPTVFNASNMTYLFKAWDLLSLTKNEKIIQLQLCRLRARGKSSLGSQWLPLCWTLLRL